MNNKLNPFKIEMLRKGEVALESNDRKIARDIINAAYPDMGLAGTSKYYWGKEGHNVDDVSYVNLPIHPISWFYSWKEEVKEETAVKEDEWFWVQCQKETRLQELVYEADGFYVRYDEMRFPKSEWVRIPTPTSESNEENPFLKMLENELKEKNRTFEKAMAAYNKANTELSNIGKWILLYKQTHSIK